MNELATTSEVIDALGGTTRVARLTGRKLAAVSNWREKQSFPPSTFLVMQAALAKAERSAPATLWGMLVPPAALSDEAGAAA